MDSPLTRSQDYDYTHGDGDSEYKDYINTKTNISTMDTMSVILTTEGAEVDEGELMDIDLGLHAPINEKKNIFQKIKQDTAALKAMHLGFAFCLLFLGFDACQDLVTTFHEKDGSAGLAILYVVYGISSFLAPVIVEKIGIRTGLLVASIGYVMFIICVEPYLDVIFFPISVVEGVAAAVLWTAQPVYLSKCAPDPSVLGKFSGIFYAIFQSALILGNILSGALISSGIKQEDLLYILAGISFGGSIALALLPNPKTAPVAAVKNEKLAESMELETPDGASAPVKDSKETEKVVKTPPLELLVKTLKLSVTSKMLWLHPIFIHQGLSNAIFMGAFPLQMRADRIGFVIATLGVSNVVGSLFWGKVYDWKGWKALTLAALILGPLAYFTSTLNSIGLWPLFLAAVLFGLMDSCQNTLVFGIISSVYPKDQEQICAFAVSRFSNACASGASFFSIPYLSYTLLAVIASGNIIIVCGCITGLYLWQSFTFPPALSFLNKSEKHEQFHDEV